MLPRMSPVYTSSRSDKLSRISPIFRWIGLSGIVIVVFIGASAIPAQQQQSPLIAGQNHGAVAQDSESSAESASSDRQLQIAQQSAGLLQMAKSLKAELDATSSETLSVAAFRKADAIERFTQTVKDQNKHSKRKP